jgi:hypothetical protein
MGNSGPMVKSFTDFCERNLQSLLVKSQGRWITEGATHSVSSRLVRFQG